LYGTLQWKKKKKTQKSLMGLHGSQKQNKRKIKKGNKTKERGWRALAATEEDKKKERRKASLTVHGTKHKGLLVWLGKKTSTHASRKNNLACMKH